MTAPAVAHTHTWDGTPTFPTWLPADRHSWDGTQLVIHTPDGDAHPRPGWWLIGWTDGLITVASPAVADRAFGVTGLAGRCTAAETALAQLARPTYHMATARAYTARSRTLVDAISRTLHRHGCHVPDMVLYSVADAIIRADAIAALNQPESAASEEQP